VESVPKVGLYTLCFEDGQPAKNGKEVEEDKLEVA
jgi:hypothetical protein